MRTFLAKTVLHLVSLFSLSTAHVLGRVMGRRFYKSQNELQRVAQKNIDLCFPDLGDQEKDKLLRESLEQTGMAMLETGPLWLWSKEKILGLVKDITGLDLVEDAIEKGNGVILVLPHLGCWEIIGLYFSNCFPMTSLYRPPKLEGMDQLVQNSRERMGAKLVPTDANGVRALRKALSDGELVAILPDQDPGKGAGVFAPFFGIEANTMTLLPRLARKSEATLLTAYAERLPEGLGFHIHVLPAPDCIADEDPVVASACLNKAIEKCVRKFPAQFQWGYKRFKTRPDGEKRFYSRRK